MGKTLIPYETIENRIFLIRGQKVMLDRDLAALYGVENYQLKRQVKRNIDRFPADFMFALSDKETDDMVCHFGIPSRSYFGGSNPYAFTEHGILMLSSVLKSKRAVSVNIQIMRTFIKLRKMLSKHASLARKLKELEGRVGNHDEQIKSIFDAINELIEMPDKTVKNVGFLKDR